MRTFESSAHYHGKFVEVEVEYEPVAGIKGSYDPQEQEGTNLIAVWLGKEDILAELDPNEVNALEREADEHWDENFVEEMMCRAEARMEMHLDR